MPSTEIGAGAPAAGRSLRHKFGIYAIPLVAVPGALLGGTGVSASQPVAVVNTGTPRAGAISQLGVQLDRRLVRHQDELAAVRSASLVVEDEVFELRPKSVRRHAAKLVRRPRGLGVVETAEDLRLQAIAND